MQAEAIDITCFYRHPRQPLQGLFVEVHLYFIALDEVFPRFDAIRLVIYARIVDQEGAKAAKYLADPNNGYVPNQATVEFDHTPEVTNIVYVKPYPPPTPPQCPPPPLARSPGLGGLRPGLPGEGRRRRHAAGPGATGRGRPALRSARVGMDGGASALGAPARRGDPRAAAMDLGTLGAHSAPPPRAAPTSGCFFNGGGG